MISAAASDSSYLSIENLSHCYGQKPALQSISLTVQQGKVLALLGPSGSGKSTLLAAVAGMIKPSEGKIRLAGINLLDLPPESRRLGMVFQDYALWPHMTVSQNVAFPLQARRALASEIPGRVADALARVGLQSFAERRPHELSGGQQQRVALARAVVGETRLLLLDEPLSALDPATRASVRVELAEILRRLGLTTIIVTHDREEAFELADSVAVLVDGEVQQHSTAEDVYERPANPVVARFMGINLLEARLLGDRTAELHGDFSQRLQLSLPMAPGIAYLAIVPEQVQVVEPDSTKANVFAGRIIRTQYCGGEYRLWVRIGQRQTGPIVEARSKRAPDGDQVLISLPAQTIHVIRESPNAAVPASAHEIAGKFQLIGLEEKIA
jgi:putative spermidine/putrescine transport system ATP-binding protein